MPSFIRNSIFLHWFFLIINYLVYKFRYLGKVTFAGLTYIYASGKSQIIFQGKGTWINNYSVSNLFGLSQRTIFYAKNGGIITIGEACGISGTSFCAQKEITIGNRVQIGANTKIMDNDMHSLNPIDRANGDDLKNLNSVPVIIGDDCFIGAQCIILKGTSIGKNCIVGAGSVVHGSFPDNVIIAGNPAKIVKHIKS